jgi:hypothetical protein
MKDESHIVANYHDCVLGIWEQAWGGTYSENEKAYSEANIIFYGAMVGVLA